MLSDTCVVQMTGLGTVDIIVKTLEQRARVVAPQRRQAQDGMHPAWRQFETADGVPYFYNAVLGRSTWEKPPALFSRQVRVRSQGFVRNRAVPRWAGPIKKLGLQYHQVTCSSPCL